MFTPSMKNCEDPQKTHSKFANPRAHTRKPYSWQGISTYKPKYMKCPETFLNWFMPETNDSCCHLETTSLKMNVLRQNQTQDYKGNPIVLKFPELFTASSNFHKYNKACKKPVILDNGNHSPTTTQATSPSLNPTPASQLHVGGCAHAHESLCSMKLPFEILSVKQANFLRGRTQHISQKHHHLGK